MKRIDVLRGRRHRGRWLPAVATLVLGGFAALAAFGASPALAASVNCGGKLSISKDEGSDNTLSYRFKCSESLKGYSIVSNREVAYFTTEVGVLKGTEVAEGEAFTCEGAIPSNGIGCYGNASAGNWVEGSIGLLDELCADPKQRPRFWLVSLTEQEKSGKPFPLTSEPFNLGAPNCRKELAAIKRAETKKKRAKAAAKKRAAINKKKQRAARSSRAAAVNKEARK